MEPTLPFVATMNIRSRTTFVSPAIRDSAFELLSARDERSQLQNKMH